MVGWSYEISLLVFNSISHELNRRREIPYLRAPMYYTLCAYLKLKTVKKQIINAPTVLPKLPGWNGEPVQLCVTNQLVRTEKGQFDRKQLAV